MKRNLTVRTKPKRTCQAFTCDGRSHLLNVAVDQVDLWGVPAWHFPRWHCLQVLEPRPLLRGRLWLHARPGPLHCGPSARRHRCQTECAWLRQQIHLQRKKQNKTLTSSDPPVSTEMVDTVGALRCRRWRCGITGKIPSDGYKIGLEGQEEYIIKSGFPMFQSTHLFNTEIYFTHTHTHAHKLHVQDYGSFCFLNNQ